MRRPILLLGLLLAGLASLHCEDTVTKPAGVAEVRVTPAGTTIAVGETAVFTAEARDAAGNVLSGKSFQFSSTDAGIAAVENTQVNPATFTAVATGQVGITATCEGKIGRATLTVQLVPDIQVTGLVIDAETRNPIANAIIDIELEFDPPRQTATNASGTFAFVISPGQVSLKVTARSSGYVASVLRLNGIDISGPALQLETLQLVPNTGMTGGIAGVVRNARNNEVISSATVAVFQGQGRGSILKVPFASTVSAVSGNYAIQGLPAGTYTVHVTAQGYTIGFRTGIAVGNGDATPNQDVALSPNTNEIRIVLTWGSSPNDLDSHLTGPNPSDASRFHVYYDNRLDPASAPYAGLDLDDTSGGGPETVTVTRLNSGNYRYSVHDYSNRRSASSTALGASGAKVELHLPDGAGYFYFVPNQPGTLWTVFELSGDINSPTITPRNTMGIAEDPADITKPEANTDESMIGATTMAAKR